MKLPVAVPRLLKPKTLKGQALLVLTFIFLMSQLMSLYIFSLSRDRSVLLAEASDLADRIIGIVELAERFPPADRLEILAAAQSQLLSMYPSIDLPDEQRCLDGDVTQRISERLGQWSANYPGLDFSVCVRQLPEADERSQSPMVQGFDVLLYVDFPDGAQSIFHATLPDAPSLFQDIAVFYISIVGVLSLLSGWFLISRALAPLGSLTRAADKMGVNIDTPSLPEEGPEEVRVAAKAFNHMQSRIGTLLRGQTEMIAAISHDLRSALTRIQLRTELLQDEAEREGLLRVVSDMRLMIQSVLDFVRGVEPTEKPRNIDIMALLESLFEDMREEGSPIQLRLPEQGSFLVCRPSAMKRCFHNVIENAVKHGGSAMISATERDGWVVITVEDSGPGVPEEELENILQPFYRLERSRNLDSGGSGLGLSIARNVVEKQGGQLHIANREGGGFRVEIRLPLIGGA